eukprot:scaffold38900_cov22-Tisochrysis_lutea.AAC.2
MLHKGEAPGQRQALMHGRHTEGHACKAAATKHIEGARGIEGMQADTKRHLMSKQHLGTQLAACRYGTPGVSCTAEHNHSEP